MIAPLPDNEDARLEALRRYDILDTAPETAFDDFTRLAAHICGVPTAMVSLVAEDRQWFKAKVGMPACQTSRDVSFCSHALLQSDVFIIPDAAADPRFADNPLVTGDLSVRFYAGAPLITSDGHALGALCAIDQVPRTLTPEQQDALQTLARQVVAQLELRRSLAESAAAERALRESQAVNTALLESSLDGIITMDAQERVIEWNPSAEAMFGYSRSEVLGRCLSDLIIPEALREAHRRGRAHFLAPGEGPVLNQRIEVLALRADGTEFPAELTALPVRLDDRFLFTAYVRDITERKAAEAARLRANSVLFAQQEAAIDGILVVDEKQRVVSHNRRFRELWCIPDDLADRGGDTSFLAHALSQLRDPDEFLRKVTHLYAHPQEHSRDELHLKDGRVFDRYSGPAMGTDGRHYGRVWYFRDITERKRTEGALRQAHDELEMHVHERTMQLERVEEDYRSLFENAVDGIFQTRPDGSYLRANSALATLYGYASPEELMAELRATNLYVESGRRAEFARLMCEHDAVSEFESAVRRKDGTIIWISESSRAIRDDKGEIMRYEGMVVDITERNRAQEALRASHEMLQSIMDSIPQRIFWKDLHSVYQGGNRNFARAAGLTRPEDIVGLTDFDLPWETETAEWFRAVDRRVMDSNMPELNLVEAARQAGGEQTWAETNKIPLHDAEGRVVGVLGTYEDITERRQAEEALRDRTQILGNILSTIPHLVFWKDTDLVYQGGNVNIARAAGLSSPEEIVGKTDYDLPWTAEETAAFRDLDRRVMTSGEPMLNVEQTMLRADGVSVTGLTSKIPMRDEAGHIFGVLGIYHDITERRQAEEALRASEERLRTVVAGAPLILFAVDADGVFTFSDGRGLNALGQTPGQVVGQSIFEVYGDHDGLLSTIHRVLAGETVSSVLEIGGTVFETLLSPQYDEGGTVSGAIGVSLDVTERQWAESEILNLNAQLEQRLDRITMLNFELAQAYDATIEGWSRALDLRDKETEGHSRRVTDLTLRLADAFGFSSEEMIHIRRGALLHDIGKMGIPDVVLLKPGPLSGSERALMERHPDYAREMLSPIEFLRPALEIPYGHHEKWDGTGYPQGLAGCAIPLPARLFAVVDVWDALRSDRPYRSAWSLERTRDHIASLAGTHFDPQVVRAFLEYVAAEAQAKERPLQAA